MKLSELIKELKEKLEDHGDLKVTMFSDLQYGEQRLDCCYVSVELLDTEEQVIEISGEFSSTP